MNNETLEILKQNSFITYSDAIKNKKLKEILKQGEISPNIGYSTYVRIQTVVCEYHVNEGIEISNPINAIFVCELNEKDMSFSNFYIRINSFNGITENEINTINEIYSCYLYLQDEFTNGEYNKESEENLV